MYKSVMVRWTILCLLIALLPACNRGTEYSATVSPGSAAFLRKGKDVLATFAFENQGAKPLEDFKIQDIRIDKQKFPDVIVGTVGPGVVVRPQSLLKNVKPGVYPVHYRYSYRYGPKPIKPTGPFYEGHDQMDYEALLIP